MYGVLRVLEQHGLIRDHGAFHVPGSGGMQNEYEISPDGDYLINRLAAPDPTSVR